MLVHFDDLYRAALRLTGNVTDAEDLTQDTCLRAFECLDQLRNSAAARLWVFTILRSIFLRRIERQSAQPRQISLDAADTSLLRPGEILPDVHEAALAVEETTLAEAREGLAKLPVPYREPIVLAHLGFSYKEIAETLGIPLGTVMSRLCRGRRLLRGALRDPRSRTRTAS